ncbi:MAG: Cys-tRNA(Pro) deacylase [Cyanobacteriota bacterium]|nr:Cys-tRNA(Pro) deacylase [Cyanobacteriota bacterium]MDY6358898.1 Cys-tRNA(Pro) deacylase [Cyanobacteriota bacterium]MDY6363985.1 Cys-tRNA(Pro) deacylase [Cyanobacteriota bacterium]MDY6382962.1 Cys-tRNA(Pro) deacylase [Cyanobacteriota bacterium]
MEHKTNAMRELDKLKVKYTFHSYTQSDAVSGMEVASELGENPDHVFKTLVTVGKSGKHYVFMLPVDKELDLKKAAKSVKEKSVEMVKSKELLGLTGYIHGGCSPVGMKRFFTTTIHSTAQNYETIMFSGGKIGYQLEMSLDELSKAIKFNLADIIVS